MIVRILRALFPFWWLFWGLAIATGTGLWIHWYPRWQGMAWGVTEMVHVFLGWPALALYLGYNVHHLMRHWGDFREKARVLGVLLTGSALVAFASGVWLVLPSEGGPPGGVKGAHFWSTFPIFPLVLWHTWRVMTGWLRAQVRSGSPPPAEDAASAEP